MELQGRRSMFSPPCVFALFFVDRGNRRRWANCCLLREVFLKGLLFFGKFCGAFMVFLGDDRGVLVVVFRNFCVRCATFELNRVNSLGI